MKPKHLPALLFLAAPLALCACTDGPVLSPPPADQQKAAVRTPTFNFDKKQEGGCAAVLFYKLTADSKEALTIWANKKKLGLPDKGAKSFDLAGAPDDLRVQIDLWEKAPRFRRYCNDIGADTKIEATWKAKKGKLTITYHGPAGEKNRPDLFKASARLEGVVFEDGKGNQATLQEETITEVLVGWYAG
jgi:hypothetical protein